MRWIPSELKNFETLLKFVAETYGLEWRKCSTYHFHLKGNFLVNVYPTRGTFYIQGSNHKGDFNKIEDLAQLAIGSEDKLLTGIEKGKKQGKSRGKRKAIWQDEKNRFCFVCKGPIENFLDCNLEHKVPLSKGGSNRPDNLALSHYSCNYDRGNNLRIKEI